MIDLIPKALYPLVPKAPGVPNLLRSAVQILDTATLGYLGLGDALNEIIGAPITEWGVFTADGKRIGDYDSFYSMQYHRESEVSDYPLEEGSFTTYNKVDAAYDVMVVLNCGGSAARRGEFQAACEAARASLELYTVLTPSKSYTKVNWVGIATRHETTDGAALLKITLIGREIRNDASAAYSIPKSAAAFKELDQGQLQPINDPTIADASTVV